MRVVRTLQQGRDQLEYKLAIMTHQHDIGEILDIAHLLSLGHAQHFGMEWGNGRSYCAGLVAVPGLRLAPKHWTVTVYHRQKSTQLMSVFTEMRKTKLSSFFMLSIPCIFMSKYTEYILFFIFYRDATAPSGPRPPHSPGFMITLRHTTLGRTPLDK
jgi:hypothetical protein